MASRAEVLEVIDGERTYQDNLPPERYDGRELTIGDYLTLMRTYLREAEDRMNRCAGNRMAMHSVRKITALGIKAMMQFEAPTRAEETVDLAPFMKVFE